MDGANPGSANQRYTPYESDHINMATVHIGPSKTAAQSYPDSNDAVLLYEKQEVFLYGETIAKNARTGVFHGNDRNFSSQRVQKNS